YTPYSRAWKARVTPRDFESEDPDLSRLTPESELPPQRGNLTLDDLGFAPGELWLEPGEAAARTRLEDFRKQIDDYHERRDIPGIEGTSGLSVHLRHGTISIRECFRAAASRSGKGPQKWYDELIWREFYHMILACFPQVVGGTFQPKYADIDWPGTDEHFQAWADGRTGYPIVDAGMRCLKATGWMHNRLRMIAASFLTKDLLVDWRRGEEWFALQLLDFELASNNGGWQWASGTGADAQPYFRIFNPELQSRKFDADGAFIREWVPELAEFSDAEIHAPHKTTPLQQVAAGCRIGEDYPAPIVDHHEQKPKAMALFKFDPEADPVRR
ncbi:MAG: FAD-binding domain-containing protein, partial [Fimbriimonadaceae bacterium]|nr:FAD-binding domain-containing protein [Fimbriimonadaceae bacterium]